MTFKTKPLIGITLGDPAGVGPEVVAKTLASKKLSSRARFLIIGEQAILRQYRKKFPANVFFHDLNIAKPADITVGNGNTISARTALACLEEAVHLLKGKKIQALVTAPVSKENISSLGSHFQGHTEYLAEAFGVKNVEMMFVGDQVRTIVATRHIPLNAVSRAITRDKILATIKLGHMALQKFFKITQPRIAVCGLNPHAGEGGTIGSEEITQIIPAIATAKKSGLNVSGPFAADTLFNPSITQNFDLIIAMYHDQGLVGIKALYFNELVNMTVGLPFIRTSPAHGTAFTLAGKNKADPASMAAAVNLAAKLALLQGPQKARS